MDRVDLYVASSADGMGRCGWGGVLVFGVHQKVLSGIEQTNGTSRTQLLAVLRALLLLKRPVEVTVHTNCQYLARWLEHGYERKDQALADRVNEVRTLTRERGLRLSARLAEGSAGLEAAKRAARSAVDEAPALSVAAQPGGQLFASGATRSVDAWTDGACSGNPGAGGWGVVLRHGEHVKELYGGEPDTTNNRMELTAVLKAVEALKQPTHLNLHTDSALVIGLLSQGWKRKNADLKILCEQVEALAASKAVVLCFSKVRGHTGIDLNERADELARQGVREL